MIRSVFSSLHRPLYHRYSRCFAKLVRPSPLFNDHDVVPPSVLPDLNINWDKINDSLTKRKLKQKISHLPNLEQDVMNLIAEFKEIDKERQNTQEMINTAQKEEKQSLYDKIKLLRKDRAALSAKLRPIQRDFLNAVLELPNLVNCKCSGEKNILKCCTETSNDANGLNLIWDQEKDDVCNSIIGHYLTGRLAILDLRASESCYDWLCQQGYIPIQLSDLVRLTPLQGIGKEVNQSIEIDPKKDDFVTIDNETFKNPFRQTFLSGSASVESFASYLMRMQISHNSLPLKLSTLGNLYYKDKKVNENTNPISQTKQVSLFEVHDCDEAGLLNQCDKLVDTMWNFWSAFSIPIRLVIVPAPELENYECLRYSIEYAGKESFELCRVSMIGDWISRRLMIKSINGDYLNMIHASVFSFEKVIRTLEVNGSVTIPRSLIDDGTWNFLNQK